MQVVIEYQGKQYRSKENNDHTPSEVCDMFYEKFELLEKFKMELHDGGVMIFGKQALQQAVVMFLP
jgi:hypothetical protein